MEEQMIASMESEMLEQTEDSSAEEVDALRREVERLQNELAKKEREQQEQGRELQEFAELFPGVSVDSIPESIWEQVRGGIPLRAAYALYEKEAARQREVNQRNASRSAGALGGMPDSGYYSPEEVRRMSAKEVRQKYGLIVESMKKWN